ncbi:hypothetical protein SAMN05660657_01385 [Geodermatophilus amargosae]|uniref:NmrA-like family protein n=1 Tax=Geodermatophilus amargosae TaxID=1296565 RepID=A0A1I6YRU0_9ACTN|nr:hypothetical protein [Geodermatophilus amargosae]SFT53078.1 hypothetical protein SAMN05660657_01385 [Geodermatophilus amargosae]
MITVTALTEQYGDRLAVDDMSFEVAAGRVTGFVGPATETLAPATGRQLRYDAISSEAFTAGMSAAGLPGAPVAVLDEVFAELRDGRDAGPADGVQRALGRPPRDFVEFARTTARPGLGVTS